MRRIILTLPIVFMAFIFCNAQKIETEKVFGGYKYIQDGKRMTMRDLVKTMESNVKALELIKKAQSNNTISAILGGAGGALIGFPIGQAIGGGNANWTLAGVGAGLIVVAIPISSSANKKTKQAVELYNSTLTSLYKFKTEFKIISNGNGIGLSINF